MKKIGYLGPKGTYSEEAALLYLQTTEGELVPLETIFDVIMAVDAKKVEEGIVPIENSIEGSVNETLDLLADQDIKLKIKQEIDLPIFHSLMVKDKVKIEEIKEVLSHPQALAQCQHFLRQNLPGITTHSAPSTAAAAEWIAKGKFANGAAIASTQSAKALGLNVLAEKINDYDSVTRFVVIGQKDHVPTGNDKTSVVFSATKDQPGVLYELLGEFARREINLTKIESRPRKKILGDYLFFIDLQGHRKDEKIDQAIKTMGQKASYFKMLGSYPERLVNA
ncbi:MAG: prephenate dehydratase [Candidatus Margulisbacteria bacterium]|nr:prephenate dehydratase [Candidatus Margulisiibacteriota bacterium]